MDRELKFHVLMLIVFNLSSLIMGAMKLEELKHFTYPAELNRKDVVYIHGDTSEVTTQLKQLASQRIEKLHITVSKISDVPLDMNGIKGIFGLVELWIVKNSGYSAEKLSLIYGHSFSQNLNITRFHLHALYDVYDEDIVRFVGNMPMLELLDFSGLKSSLVLSYLPKALKGKKLKVLKLNYVKNLSTDVAILSYEFDPVVFFKGLNTSDLMCLELCGNWINLIKP